MAHYDTFLKIDGLDGESTDDKHKGEVELSSFSWGVTHLQTLGSATGGAGSGRASFTDLSITKDVDKSSAVLFQKCATGEHFAKGKLTVRKAGGQQQEYLVYTLETVFVTSYHISSAHGQESASESVTFAVGKVGMDYSPQKADGSLAAAVHGGWDVLTNKKY